MCGIVGAIGFTDSGKKLLPKIENAVTALHQRGPDMQDSVMLNGSVALGHSRLSIIDPRPEGSQPMSDVTGRYYIVFNGEFYNYKEHRVELEQRGFVFNTYTDTEVILALYITQGLAFLDKLNGCFAFSIYDKNTGECIIVRDRFGIKPLVYWQSDDFLLFSSEIKGISAIKKPKTIDHQALTAYFQLNYIPQPLTIYSEVKKLPPGYYIKVCGGNVEIKQYYSHTDEVPMFEGSYHEAQEKLAEELENAVQRRLVSDVPLGCFLSGGIDSSVTSALASKHVSNLRTFSIGYKDNPYFDETEYANLVAKKCNTNHTVFSLTNDDLLDNVKQVMDYFDEPFADSSALPVYILSMLTKREVSVALSGDGADEIFAGYNKHAAFQSLISNRKRNAFFAPVYPLLKILPQSRNNKATNTIRKAYKYLQSSRFNNEDIYWRLCSIWEQNETQSLLKQPVFEKNAFVSYLSPSNLNQSLLNDVQLVLTNDMLCKVDSMSMANGLEVRVPFLDKHVFDFAFSIPDDYKLQGGFKKRILQDAFRNILPPELYKRPKHGFEVPLLDWFRNDLRPMIDEYLSESFVHEQGIFNYSAIKGIKKQLHSISPADATAKIWALLCFQHWWKNKFI